MLLEDFDYELDAALIANKPPLERQNSRMMVLNRDEKTISHKHFFDITNFLGENDVLVLNNTKVMPARLFGKKPTGANVEVFLLKKQADEKHWEALLNPSKRIKPNSVIEINEDLSVRAIELLGEGKWLVELEFDGDFESILNQAGKIPLPPYIEKGLTSQELESLDKTRYQTVYAKDSGSVAAPTAGLHFTPEILEKLKQKGVEVCYVTLNVGLGTFKPVKCSDIKEHKMDSESFTITKEVADTINNAKKSGKNIVAVGTTSVRTLETAFRKYGEIKPCKDSSELFLYPGCKFNVIDKLITNFHLPKSTLIMLVSAFAGKDFVFKAYEEAIKERYRFYSFGDSMFIY